MILDTSALIAILLEEPDGAIYIQALARANSRRISAANFVELSTVLEGQFGAETLHQCDVLFRRAAIIIEPVTAKQAMIARDAFHDFGKGRHVAGLNFGDCFAYALAKSSGQPLLFKGGDFAKTDIVSALA